MPSIPSFIRYFAQTDATPLGRIALEYLKSLVRIAPVRIVSMTGGGPAGDWRAFEALLLTPMIGTYVSAVCCHPSKWVWRARVPMTDQDAKPDGYAEGVEELYTPKVRNVIFVAEAPSTDEQAKTMRRYQALVVPSLSVAETISARWPDHAVQGAVVGVPVSQHARIREAIVGAL